MLTTNYFCDLDGCELRKVCTTGFSVVSVASNQEGNSSAGHCGSVQWATDDLDTVDLFFEMEHEGKYGDFEWYRTGFGAVDVAWFWYDFGPNDRRKVESIEYGFSKGTWYCKFGRTTGFSCDKVRRISVTHHGVRKLVQVEGQQVWYGDSGGPWYSGGRAVGLTRGFTARTGSERHDVFSKASLMEDALGVRVKTVR